MSCRFLFLRKLKLTVNKVSSLRDWSLLPQVADLRQRGSLFCLNFDTSVAAGR